MEDLRITLVQADLRWEDKRANLDMLSNSVMAISESTDIIILPEMFTTGFSMDPARLAEDISGETVEWMRSISAKKNAVITGSFICKEGEKFYNRLVWMRPDGTFSSYDKRHLFSMGHENEHYAAGTKKIFEKVKGWTILPLVCYDLRFPVWSRRTKQQDYDLLIYVANWPERRGHAWRSLLLARAIENQCYVAGINRVGADGNEIVHSGDSAVINPLGEIISKIPPNITCETTVTLDHKELDSLRSQFPVISDADDFSIK